MATRTNLIKNPSFEETAGDYSTTGTAARITSQFYSGSACLQLTAGFAGTLEYRTGGSGTSSDVVTGVAASTQYTFQTRVKPATTNRNVVLVIHWYTSSGSYISSSTASAVAETGGWQLLSLTATSPSTAGRCHCVVQFQSAAASEVHYIDALMLEAAASAGTYFDGSFADSGGLFYTWTGLENNSASQENTIPVGMAYGRYTVGATGSQLDFESGSIPGTWTTSGGTPTVVTKPDAAAGTTKAMQFPAIAHSATAYVEFTATNFTGLRYQTSSELNFDTFKVTVNGVVIKTDSGYVEGWKEFTCYYPGTSTVRLSYTKDSSASKGLDTAWVGAIYSAPSQVAVGTSNRVARGAWDFSASSVVGQVAHRGTAAGTTTNFSGSATGTAPHEGTATGSYALTGASVTGRKVTQGAVTSGLSFIGMAAGEAPANQGAASGAYALTGSGAGTKPAWKPKNLVATPVSGSQIDLTWDALDHSTGYDIERDGVIVAYDVATSSYSDTGLDAATLYTYRVRAVQ